jgi:hypothetical protein
MAMETSLAQNDIQNVRAMTSTPGVAHQPTSRSECG